MLSLFSTINILFCDNKIEEYSFTLLKLCFILVTVKEVKNGMKIEKFSKYNLRGTVV